MSKMVRKKSLIRVYLRVSMIEFKSEIPPEESMRTELGGIVCVEHPLCDGRCSGPASRMAEDVYCRTYESKKQCATPH